MKKLEKTLGLTRKSEEITAEYQKLCMELGNEVINFEVKKSKMLARYGELNAEMTRANELEAKLKEKEQTKESDEK